MPDPKPPRPFPPPLPGAMREPFPLADSDRPPAVNRSADTPRSGGIDPKGWVAQSERELLQQELDNAKALIAALQQSQEPVTLTPVPETRPSVRVRRSAIAKAAGKYGALVTALLPIAALAARAIARKHPEYQHAIDQALDWLGL